MKKLLSLGLFIGVILQVVAGPRDVIYVTDEESKTSDPAFSGDSRIDPFLQNDERLKIYARSTAARVPLEKLTPIYSGIAYKMPGTSLKELVKLCDDERFADEPSAADCTGFLIGSDLLATAGHCMANKTSCSAFAWVFDYRTDAIGSFRNPTVLGTSVFRCKEIIKNVMPRANNPEDWAVIRLDRKVTDRIPLPLRESGEIANDASLSMIGYPVGLPLKIASKAKVVENLHPQYFRATLDSFGGNSGSPVINQENGLVEGILVRGERDFIEDEENNCMRVNVCDDSNCRGEGVTRIMPVLQLLTVLSWGDPPIGPTH